MFGVAKLLGTATAVLALVTQSPADGNRELAGRWIGAVQMGEAAPRLLLEIGIDELGTLTGTVGSPDSGASGIPLSRISRDGSIVTIEVSAAKARFVGELQGSTIAGTWNDGNRDYSLRLQRFNPDTSPLAATPGTLRQTSETTNFVLYTDAVDKNEYREVLRLLEERFLELSRLLVVTPSRKIDVWIYPDLPSFHRGIFVTNAPDWMVGAAGQDQLKFVSPFNPGPAHSYASVIAGAVHELVHTMVMRMRSGAGMALPNWLNEGYAFYRAGQLGPSQRQWLAKNYTTATLPRWSELAAMEPTTFGASQGYELSASIVAFLIDRFGEGAMREFLYRPGAFDEVFGQSEGAVESVWRSQWPAAPGP